MALTQTQLDTFHREGYIIVPDVFDPDDMKAALAEMEKLYYGMNFAQYLTKSEQDGCYKPLAFHYGFQFPNGIDPLERLIENEYYLDIFEDCLSTDQISFNAGGLFMRSGPTDTFPAEHPWQGYHIDHHTSCFLPPSREVNLYAYVNAHVYLHDVEDDAAPMHVIPGSHRQIIDLLPRLIEEGIWSGRSGITDIRKVSEFAEPVPTAAKAGSVRFNNSYVVHAAVPFKNKRKQRAHWSLSLCRADASRWTNLHVGERGLTTEFTNSFWAKTTARVRSIFGWPPAGHPYYTPETLELLISWYPGIDLAAYRRWWGTRPIPGGVSGEITRHPDHERK